MRIGFQGTRNSNSDDAARRMSRAIVGEPVMFVPLTTSQAVVDALETGDIDVGIMAMRNNIGGCVSETSDALAEADDVRLTSTFDMPIRHFLFCLPHVDEDEITCIVSHPQALAQTSRTTSRMFPSASRCDAPDTSLAATWLADGTLPRCCAVICPVGAGIACGLRLVAADVEDSPSITTFGAFVTT